jgi:hypothetical protein
MSNSANPQPSPSVRRARVVRLSFAAIAVVAALLLPCRSTHAQTTFASITGTVTDSSGSAAPGARITARSLATGIETSTTSNEVGNYTLSQLKEGAYSLQAEAPGFSPVSIRDVVLAARDVRRIDLALEVGAVQTTVEVTAGSTLIETETARIADTRTAEALKSIPLNTRTIWAPLALSPNVLQGAGSTIQFAGSKANQSNWALDGITMADGVSNAQIGTISDYVEWVQEMKIDMANNTADVGPIGQVTIISKSGTNQFHGSLFDYYSTPWFKARNPFAAARPIGVRHEPGFSAGGPVYLPGIYNGKNRTFFFTSYETARGSQVYSFMNASVPIQAWRDGDFSAIATPLVDPLAGNQPFPGNRIPATRLNPVSKALQERFYPLPNYGDTSVFASQNFRHQVSRPLDYANYVTARGDHKISDRSSIFGRFSWRAVDYPYLWQSLPALGQYHYERYNNAATVSFSHTVSPNLVLETRWGYAFNNIPVSAPINGPQFVKEYGLIGLAPDLPDISGLMTVGFSGLSLTGISQAGYTNPGSRNHLQNVQQYVSWFRKRHNLKMGFELTRVALDSYSAPGGLFGSVSFSSRFSGAGVSGRGHAYADFLLGVPTTAGRAFPPVLREANRWQYDFFIADDFKVTPQLTLNVGLRYELHLPWRESSDRIASFDIGSGQIVVADGALSRVSPLFPKGYVGIVEASSLGLPARSLLRTDRNNIAPRFGLAYRPWGNRTVFRAGYGIFYDVVPHILQMGHVVPFVLSEPSYTNPLGNPDVVFPRVFPATSTGGPSAVSLPAAVNPDLKMPYSMQWNFTAEHERWNTGFRLSYIGTNTRQASYSYDINSPVPDNRPYVDKPRRFPTFPGIAYITGGAGHQYHALTTEVERRLSRGLRYQVSWAWARDIETIASENPYGSRIRAVSPYTPTHRVTTNWVYQFPFGRGRALLSGANKPLNLAVGGWELGGVYSFYSGQFLTPGWTGPDPRGIAYTTSRTAPNIGMIPDILRDPNLPAGQRTLSRWFDTAAFAAPAAGQFGNSGLGVIKGPWANVWHMGLYKYFTFREGGLRLRLELTSTNVFNHPNWSNPNTTVSSTAAGLISGVGGVQGSATGDQPGARVFRSGIRLEW